MKNIWWINHHAVPPVVPGGTRHYSLAKEIMALGEYEVTVINGSFDHITSHFPEGADWGAQLTSPVLRSYDGVKFYTLPTPYYQENASLGRLKNMRTFYKNALRYLSPGNLTADLDKPDLIVGSTVHPLAAYVGYKLSLLYKVPFVYEIRDIWPLTLVELGKISKYNPIVLAFDYLDKIMSREARMVITTAPLMKEYYKKRYNLPDEKFIWITNGSSLIDTHPTENDLFSGNSSQLSDVEHNEVMHIGYTGAIGLANGIDIFLEELCRIDKELLKNFDFTFVGEGPRKSKLIEYCKEHNLPVHFKNAVPKNQVANILKQFDMVLVIILPSPIYRYGTSLNKIADYHAVGKPILMIGDVAQNPIIEADSGFVCTNIANLENILKEIKDCPHTVFLKKAKNALNYAVKHYDWEQLARKLNNAFNKLSE